MGDLERTRLDFIETLSRISGFWGYPRAMGALFGALYLSPDPMSLDALIPVVRVTKGAISTNIRALEQLGMVSKQIRAGDRRDYYQAETDFWKITRTILERREKPEFDRALGNVSAALRQFRTKPHAGPDAELFTFYESRLASMERFFKTIDGIVATVLQMERLRADGIRSFLPSKNRRRSKVGRR